MRRTIAQGYDDAETGSAGKHRRGLFSWAMFDWANSSFVTVIQTFVFAAYFTRSVAATETGGASLWGYTIGIAGLLVAILGPVCGAVADQKGRRKPWVAVSVMVCVIATALLWFIPPRSAGVLPGLLLVGTAVIGTEIAAIFYNAMLPAIAARERIGRWSGWGWALGYAGGLSCLVLSLFAFVREDAWFALDRQEAMHVRATFVLVAAWYTLFALPLFLWTPDEPAKAKSIGRAVRDGFGQIADTLRHLRRYRPILRFLVARMIYINGLATIFAFGGVYAAGAFDMSPEQVLMFGVALNVSAGAGAFVFAWIDDWCGSRATILCSLVGLILPGIGMLVTTSSRWFWIFGVILGLFVGPVQAASRSYLARLAPEGVRNQMFGLYALSGKATGFFGPLAVGALTQLSGSQRIGMSAIFVFLALGGAILLSVPKATP